MPGVTRGCTLVHNLKRISLGQKQMHGVHPHIPNTKLLRGDSARTAGPVPGLQMAVGPRLAAFQGLSGG
jgi:hypothetical protein